MVKKCCFDPELARAAGLAEDRFPINDDEAARAEDALAKALEKLSLEEHEKILFDIHGISHEHDEDPVELDECLTRLRTEIDLIPQKDEYVEALKSNPIYPSSRKFQLKFLRAERYDAKAAATSIVTHFAVKKRLFGGGEILGRDVRIDDLSPEAFEILEDGFAQILPKKDAAGRTVIVFCPEKAHRFKKDPITSTMKEACFYFNMEIVKDEEAQLKGIVAVMFNYSKFIEPVDFTKNDPDFQAAMPHRIDAMHYCYNAAILRPFVAGIRLFIGKESRFRFRPHYGTPEAIAFELLTFGIPIEDSPMSHDGAWSNKRHKNWISTLKRRDEEEEKNSLKEGGTTCTPRRFDVLFGKSKDAKEHTGNLRALHLCHMYWDQYESASKYVKTEIAEKIVTIIQESNGRFLKSDNGGIWTEVNFEEARAKISHFFRHMRSKSNSRRASVVSNSDESTGKVTVTLPREIDQDTSFGPLVKRLATESGLAAKHVTPCPSPDPVLV